MAIGGSYLGKKIVTRINQEKFKKIVLIAIILVSIKFVLDVTLKSPFNLSILIR